MLGEELAWIAEENRKQGGCSPTVIVHGRHIPGRIPPDCLYTDTIAGLRNALAGHSEVQASPGPVAQPKRLALRNLPDHRGKAKEAFYGFTNLRITRPH